MQQEQQHHWHHLPAAEEGMRKAQWVNQAVCMRLKLGWNFFIDSQSNAFNGRSTPPATNNIKYGQNCMYEVRRQAMMACEQMLDSFWNFYLSFFWPKFNSVYRNFNVVFYY